MFWENFMLQLEIKKKEKNIFKFVFDNLLIVVVVVC